MMKIFKNISYSTNSKVFLLQINRNHAGKVIMTVLLILIIVVIIITTTTTTTTSTTTTTTTTNNNNNNNNNKARGSGLKSQMSLPCR